VKISFRFPHTLSSNATRHHRRRSLLYACTLIAVLPLAWRGVSCGHDFDFHLQSWLEAARHWREGIFYPHWDTSANYGAGEPRFVFYPPVTWIIGALLGTLLPWSWTPLVFTLLAFLLAGLSFFKMACEWMPEDAAVVAASVYILNPYLMFVAYERTAYGELFSAALLPLLVLYGLRKQSGLLPLSLIIAALWLTNAPSAVMGCYFLAFIAPIAAARNKFISPRDNASRREQAVGSPAPHLILRTIAATIFGIALAAFYIIPAGYEERWVEISRAIAPGMRIEDSFLFEHTGAAFHDQVLHTASWIAVLMLAAAFISIWPSVKSRISGAPHLNEMWDPRLGIGSHPLALPMLTTTGAIFLLLLPFTAPVWRRLPELKFLQFPWRWLLVLGVTMSVLIGLSLRGSFLEAKTRRSILVRAVSMLALAAIMSSIAAAIFWQPCDDEDNIAAQRVTLRSTGFEGTDEYTAANSDNGSIQQGLPLVRILNAPDADEADSSIALNPQWKPDLQETLPAQISTPVWQSENKTIAITTPTGGYAVLRLVDYPAWRVILNRKPVTTRPHRDDGLMVIPIPAGQSLITIRYTATADVKLARAISLLAACILIALFAQSRRHQSLRV